MAKNKIISTSCTKCRKRIKARFGGGALYLCKTCREYIRQKIAAPPIYGCCEVCGKIFLLQIKCPCQHEIFGIRLYTKITNMFFTSLKFIDKVLKTKLW